MIPRRRRFTTDFSGAQVANGLESRLPRQTVPSIVSQKEGGRESCLALTVLKSKSSASLSKVLRVQDTGQVALLDTL